MPVWGVNGREGRVFGIILCDRGCLWSELCERNACGMYTRDARGGHARGQWSVLAGGRHDGEGRERRAKLEKGKWRKGKDAEERARK